MKPRVLIAVFVSLACIPALSPAQTRSMFSNLANPSIGLNALVSAQAAPNLNQPYGINFDDAEMSLISVVDPTWTLVSNIVFAGTGEVDPEEVWVRTNSIPNISLKLGKIRGMFGKQGMLHTHAYPFIQAPVIMANTIGEEGFKDSGLEAAWLTPVPWYMELTGGVYKAVDATDENPLDFGSNNHNNIPYGGHLKNQFDLNESTTMEFGVSGLQGRGADGHRHGAIGADLTFRNVPLRRSNQRGWILSGEYLERNSSVGGTYHRQAHGGFASFQYRLSQVWWTGVQVEKALDSYTDVLVDPATGDPIAGNVKRASANIKWAPTEFSYIRLEYSYAQADDGNGFKPHDQRIMAQASYTIGYHPAHAY
ncbi:MAG TPA: hypothetical protein VFH88_12775 [Candidatus Krumholzibacteria bacterium]|nr:hypothetical protein [Candidatus Krumholzibacteria bacterium]